MKRYSLLFVFLATFLLKANSQNAKIEQFEKNLFEVKDLIFADTLYPRFTLQDRMSFYKVPSVSIAVIENGKIVWAKAYGYADTEKKTLANQNTIYQVASISKSLTGFSIMQLVQSNRLSLDVDIRQYLKSWQFPENDLSKGQSITLKNLLSHTAGLSTRGFMGYKSSEIIPTINQVLNGEKPANNEAVKSIFQPGTQYQYSGGGYTIIQKILLDNIDKDYNKLMQKMLLQPLQMNNSRYAVRLPKDISNYALAYDANMKPVEGKYYAYPDYAAGGLWSTATDIAKFVIAVQNSFVKGTTLLDKKYAKQMLTPVLEDYALGFGIQEKGGEKYFWHEGECYGFRSLYYGSLTEGNGVVILTNAYPENGRPFVHEVLNSIAVTYGWKDFYNPTKKKLFTVTNDNLNKYVGEYKSENPPISINITNQNGTLYLTARRPEPMYPISQHTFFIPSSPNDAIIFSSSKNDGVLDKIEIQQQGKVIIRGLKQK
jgi:CubicO group peptidase (beta-lactamase class C family)